MKTPATPHSHAAEFLKALEQLQFKPGEWDRPVERHLETRNQAGHLTVRVIIAYEGEERPQNVSLIKFDGTPARLIEWETNYMSAHMPTQGLLALIKAA